MSSPYSPWARAAGGVVFAALVLSAGATAAGQGTRSDYERSAKLRSLTRNKVFRDRVEPTWSADGSWLWYRVETAADRWEFVAVDTAKGLRRRSRFCLSFIHSPSPQA